jgi:hypothetical protein
LNDKASTTDPEGQTDDKVSVGNVLGSERKAVEAADAQPPGDTDS